MFFLSLINRSTTRRLALDTVQLVAVLASGGRSERTLRQVLHFVFVFVLFVLLAVGSMSCLVATRLPFIFYGTIVLAVRKFAHKKC
jgi:hypothetical protein